MKTINKNQINFNYITELPRKLRHKKIILLVFLMLLMIVSCNRDLDVLSPAKYPTDAGVYIDGFEAGVEYQAFGGSLLTALGIDNTQGYDSKSSLTFTVPDVGDPSGMFAGGVFISPSGRDLTKYDALTFYAKASINAEIGNMGFGNNNAGDTRYVTERANVPVTTVWKKYIIPIPDPSKLDVQSGLFHTAIGAKDGLGFKIWYDEIQFEKLGTIAHKKPMIFDGQDKVENVVNGSKIQIDGLTVSFNMPDGKDQTVNAAPGYYNFESSNTNVATVDSLGKVSVLTAGTAVITADIGGVDAEGSLTVQSSGDFAHAPSPTADAADVISIFSDAYTNVPVDFFNGYWEPYQTTLSADFQADGDSVLSYTNFNFVGIEFTSPTIDATNMTYLHMDIFIPNAVGSADKLLVSLVDMGADGAYDEPNNTLQYTVENSTLKSQEWVSVDIDLSGLATKSNFFRIIMENSGTTSISGFYLDNIYLYKGEGGGGGDPTEPTTAAPDPTAGEADVISIFSDAYTNLEGTDYPNWGQTTLLSNVPIEGNETIKMAGLNFQGIQLATSQDFSAMTSLHIDVWTANSTSLDIYLISTGSVEVAYAITVPTDGWSSVDIPLSSFSGVDLTDVIQLKFDGNGDVWFDNLYFYKESGGGDATEPTTAAPNPTQDAADVISIFSDAYTNLEGTDYPNWGQTTLLSNVPIEGNETIKMAGLNFQGIQLATSQDFSAMTSLHIDVWTANSTSLDIYLISTGPVEVAYAITVPTDGWSSVDIPISSFSGVDLTDVIQLKFDEIGDVWFDNLYFYTSSGGGETEPTTAAPTPTEDAANVVSIYSDAYTDITTDNFDAGWCGGAAVTGVMIAGNNTLKKNAGIDCHGIDFSSNKQDLSTYTHIHFDFYTDDTDLTGDVFNIKLVDFGGGTTEVSSLEININTGTTPAIISGSWVSVDVDITSLGGVVAGSVTRSDIAQIGITTANLTNVWYDNIYFYKEAGGGGGDATEPTTAAPEPTADPADVYSLFSDTYTNTDPSTFTESWGEGSVDEFQIGTNNIKKYTNLNYQAIGLSQTLDLANYTHIHVDVWTPIENKFGIKFQDFGADNVDEYPNADDSEMELPSSTPQTAGTWVGHDFAIADFSGLSGTAHLGQIQVLLGSIQGGTTGTAFIDNIYFYSEAGGGGGDDDDETGPTTAAPTPPVRDAANVVSIYSDAYTNISFDNFDAGWCGGLASTEVTISGNNTLKKNAGIECHGIDFSSNRQDLSSFTHIHFDFYTDDTDLTGDVFNVKLVDFAGGDGEASALEVNINTGTTPAIISGTWVSVDIDITSLGGIVTNSLARSDVAQIGITTANLTNVWYDNIYLYK